MSEYRHFIAYIYKYEEGRKTRNAGFVKVNIRNGIARMQIKLKAGKMENERYRIYGVFHEEPWIYGIAIGTMEMKNGICEGGLLVKESVLEERGYQFAGLSGLWMQKEAEKQTGEFFLTVWDEKPINWKAFVTELPEKEENGIEKENSGEKESSTEEENVEETEVEVQQAQEDLLKDRWQQFQYHYPQVEPFGDDEIRECIRITPKDITFLGEKERSFCNSPFVQQKYIKYQHLLLGIHKNGRYVLAVPGLNRNTQDKNLAAMYGFPEYKAAQKESYGYWYHFL